MEVKVTRAVMALLHNEALIAGGEECCGLLLGQMETQSGMQRIEKIDLAVPTANLAQDPHTHFEIDPKALIAAHKAAREGGRQVLGYYHSHPTGLAVPSTTDEAHSSGDLRVWAIIAQSKVAFWRDSGDGFTSLLFRVVD